MDHALFSGIVTAVFIANMLTALVIYGIAKATQRERNKSPIPQHVYIAIILPLGFVVLYLVAYPPL
jgi:hypothetical protein